MARPCLLDLKPDDRLLLTQEIAGTTVADVRDACRAVLLIADGKTRAEAGKVLGVHPATIGRWVARFRKRGIAGVYGPETDGRGRPPLLTARHLEVLRRAAVGSPADFGYAFTAWTLPRLASHLYERTGVTAQPQYLGRLLRRMGITRRRPKHVLEGKRDEEQHAQAKRELAAIKGALPTSNRIVISQDEAEFHLFPYLVLVWGLVGSPQPRIKTPGKSEKRVLYGGLNLKTGRLTSYWASTKSGPRFISFLDCLLAEYHGQSVLLIADNGSFHHTKAVEAYLAEHGEQLEVKWLPSYCPDLNDIERTWRRLKASHASNFLFNSLDALVENVRKGIAELNSRCAPLMSSD